MNLFQLPSFIICYWKKVLNPSSYQLLISCVIDKDGEPDYYYIEENLKRELTKYDSDSILITQGFICRNASGKLIISNGRKRFHCVNNWCRLKAGEIQIWTDINGFIIMIRVSSKRQKLFVNYHLMRQLLNWHISVQRYCILLLSILQRQITFLFALKILWNRKMMGLL